MYAVSPPPSPRNANGQKRFYQIKNKLGLDQRAGSSPKTPRKTRTAASQDELGDDVSETPDKTTTPTKATPTKATKRRKTAATPTAACAPDLETPDIVSTPATPSTPVHSTGFTPINGPHTTPTKAKPKGRTPLSSKSRKTPAGPPAADVPTEEPGVAGDDGAAIPVASTVKAEVDEAGEV